MPRLDIAHLEHKVEGLEAQIRKLSVNSVGSNGSQTQDMETDGQLQSWPQLKQVDSALSMASSKSMSSNLSRRTSSVGTSGNIADPLFLDLKEEAPGSMTVYRGRTTGVEIMRSLRHLCDTFVGFRMEPNRPATEIVSALDSKAPFARLPVVSLAGSFFSPVHMIRKWITFAFDEAFVLWHFIDRDAIDNHVQQFLEAGVSDQDGCDNDLTGLLHSIIALGQRHDPDLVTSKGNRYQWEETRG